MTSIGIFFQSLKGVYLLDWGWNAVYIGGDIEDSLAGFPITGGVEVPALNQVRLYTQGYGVTLVWDTLFKVWTTFTGQYAQAATSWQSAPCFLDTIGVVHREVAGQFGDDGSFISSLVTLAFIAPAQLRGYFCLFALQLLGEVKGPHLLNATLGYSSQAFGTTSYTYNNSSLSVWGGDPTWGSGLWGGASVSQDGVLKVEIRPKKRQSASYQLTVWDGAVSSGASEGFTLQAVSASVGMETGLARTNAGSRMAKT